MDDTSTGSEVRPRRGPVELEDSEADLVVRVHPRYVRVLGLAFDELAKDGGVGSICGQFVYLGLAVYPGLLLCGARGGVLSYNSDYRLNRGRNGINGRRKYREK